MRPRFRPILILAALSASFAVAEEKPTEIPLKSIWAHRMPGTRNINELDDGRAQKTLIGPLLKHIRKTWNNDHGVAVQGEGLDALKHFYRIEVEGENIESLPPNVPISIVFYTNLTDPYVQIRSVTRKGNQITIHYHFTPHRTAVSPQHIALIPLGKMTPGKYDVKIERLPLEREYVDQGMREPSPEQVNFVCDSFSFLIAN